MLSEKSLHGSYLGAGDHDSVTEAEMQHCLAVVYERVHHLARADVPDAHRGVAGAGDYDVVVVLETQHGAGVARQHLNTLQRVSVPDLPHTYTRCYTHNVI